MAETDLGSIPTQAKRFKRDGYPISEHALRQLVKSGKIRARFIGPKALISRNEVLRYFQCIDGCDNAPTTAVTDSSIRRVEV